MSDFNKGDFTQQGVDGHVRATLRLNEKRYVELDLTTNENARGCTISGNVHDRLNNLDYPIGAAKTIESKTITENGTYNASSDDCDGYNPVTVNVPQPSGNIAITENTAEGEPLNIAQYATATVNVPQPSGNIAITENTAEGEPLDISQYATATVNVAGGGGITTANITFVPTFPNGETFIGVELGPLATTYQYYNDVDDETIVDSFTGNQKYSSLTENPVVTIPVLLSNTLIRIGSIVFYDTNSDSFGIDPSTIVITGDGSHIGNDLVVSGDCTVTCTLSGK